MSRETSTRQPPARWYVSGELALAQPVYVVMTGTLGTGDLAFPSAFRSVESKPSQLVGMDQALAPTEKNGFTIIDVTSDKMTFTMFDVAPAAARRGN